MKLLGITQSVFDPASRVRFIQFIPVLEAAGWQVSHRPNRPDRQWVSPLGNRVARGLHFRAGRLAMRYNRFLDVRDASTFDVVFVNRDLTGGTHPLHERLLFRRNRRVIFDFDDAVFVGRKNRLRFPLMCRRAGWVTAGNVYLAEEARRHTRSVSVFPTVIDTDAYRVRRSHDSDDATVRIGWSGSDQSISTTLFPYLEMLRDLQREIDFELVIVSNTKPHLPVGGLRWVFHPWSPETEGEISRLFDVGIMPLVDDEFQRGKCGMKLLQYMAAGLPTVASPVGVNCQIVDVGVTGFLPASPRDWKEALRALAQHADVRSRMGTEGRRRCEESYSVRRWAPELLRLLERMKGLE